MRLLVNFDDFGYSVVSISRLHYSHSDSELIFCTVDGDWYKIPLEDSDFAADCIYNCLTDGFVGLAELVSYHLDTDDFLEE